MSPFTFAWVFWIATFAAIEGAALLNKQSGDTLSEHMRKWFSTTTKAKGYRLRRLVLVIGLAWFPLHILTNGYI